MSRKHLIIIILFTIVLSACAQTSLSGPLNITGGGSASAPAIILASDTDTGLYHSAADQLDWATGGSNRMSLTSSGLTIANGLTVSAGSVNFPSGSITLPDLVDGVISLGPSTHTVCSANCDYSSISSAIAAASAGDTILIGPESFNENINVSKQLSLIGIDYPVINAVSAGAAITVSAASVHLNNLKVVASDDNNAIYIDANGTIINNVEATGGPEVASGAGAGISLNSGTTYIYNTKTTGGQDGGNGLYLDNTASAFVYSSVIQGGDSSAGDAGAALSQFTSGTTTIYGSTITGGNGTAGGMAGAGISTMSGVIKVYGSQISAGTDNGGGGNKGIEQLTTDATTIVASSITGNIAADVSNSATFAIRNSYLKSTEANQPVIQHKTASSDLEVDNSILIATGSPTAAITCASGTTLTLRNTTSNVKPILEPSDCTNDAESNPVYVLYNTVSRSDTTNKTMGTIPAHANIVDIWFLVGTASDAGTSAVVDCGTTSADPDEFVDNLDVKTAGLNRMGDAADMPVKDTAGAGAPGDVGSSDITVLCKYTESGTASTTGGPFTLAIFYMID